MKKINDNITAAMMIGVMVYLGIAIALLVCEGFNLELVFKINDIQYCFSNDTICEFIKGAGIILTAGEIVLLCIGTSIKCLLEKES